MGLLFYSAGLLNVVSGDFDFVRPELSLKMSTAAFISLPVTLILRLSKPVCVGNMLVVCDECISSTPYKVAVS